MQPFQQGYRCANNADVGDAQAPMLDSIDPRCAKGIRSTRYNARKTDPETRNDEYDLTITYTE